MRKEKQLLLDEKKEQIQKDGSFIIMQYRALQANQAGQLRREVAKLGGSVEVMPKRILLKAAEASGIQLYAEDLEGHIGVVYGGHEPLTTAKYVIKYGEENNNAVQVVGGRFDGVVYRAAEVATLAQLPSKDEMRAQLLGLFEAPMAQTLAVVDAILTSVIHCLENKSKSEGEKENSLTESLEN
jgi:large subunit ribosomal protein L10